MPAKVRHVYAEEVAHLLPLGMAPESIAARLCTTVSALSRALYREARPELANPFQRLVNERRSTLRRQGRLTCN